MAKKPIEPLTRAMQWVKEQEQMRANKRYALAVAERNFDEAMAKIKFHLEILSYKRPLTFIKHYE